MAYSSPVFPVLDALTDGRIIRRVVTIALYVIAVLVLLAGAVGVVMTLGLTFRMGSTADVTVGGVLYAVLVGATCLAIFEILRYRARTVSELGQSAFTVMPVMSIIFRLVGEIYGVALLGIGAGGFILNLFGAGFLSSSSPFGSAPFLSDWTRVTAGGFVGGLTFLALTVLGAFAVLLVFYFLAEMVLVAADIARNVQTLVSAQQPSTDAHEPAYEAIGIQSDFPGGPRRMAPSPVASRRSDTPAFDRDSERREPPIVHPPSQSRCPSCSQGVEPDSVFCANCGARLGPGKPFGAGD